MLKKIIKLRQPYYIIVHKKIMYNKETKYKYDMMMKPATLT